MPETINSLIRAIGKKNDQENRKYQWIILIDELIIITGLVDFKNLCIIEDIDILIGVSPNSHLSAGNMYRICLPKSQRIIAKRLVFKHRNTLELNVFLAHLNFYFTKEFAATPLSNIEDMPLVDSCFPAIDRVKLFKFYILLKGIDSNHFS